MPNENLLIMADGVKLEAMLLNLISACIKTCLKRELTWY